MKRNIQKLMALTLSTAFLMGSFVTVHATESELGQVPEEEVEKEEVSKVILPTSEVDIFDFILDPQELIYKTNAAAYGGKRFEEGATLFFQRSDGRAEEDYTSDSDGVLIANRGSGPVDVEVKASITVSEAEGLAMTDDREFTDDTRASLYLALTDGETVVPITLEEGANICVELPAAVEGTDEDGLYSFWLTGACNKNGDWSELKDMGIEVKVTWNVVSRKEEPVPENEDEETVGEDKTATPSDATMQGENSKVTPSEATASNVDKGPVASASDADKNVSETPTKATASEADAKPIISNKE